MKILSFDYNEIKRDKKQFNLFNLFEKNIILDNKLQTKEYVVPREFEMRLDRISYQLYGSTDYVEELMLINDLISPYSIKEGQILRYYNSTNFNSLYTNDQLIKEEKKPKLISSNSKTNKDINSSNELKQISITKDNKLSIINTF